MKFVKIKDLVQKKEYWLLQINNLKDFKEFKLKQNFVDEGIKDFNNDRHPDTPIGSFLDVTSRINQRKILDPMPLINNVFNTMETYVKNGEILLINPFMGYRIQDKNDIIIDIAIKDVFIFPINKENSLRIISWEGGKHFYVKVGNIDVVVDQDQKWNSEEEARKAGIYFMENILPYMETDKKNELKI
jgi:hypothetical protein